MTNEDLVRAALEKVGGKSNVLTATNCMTRLRVRVKDDAKIDDEGLKAIEGVMGIVHDRTGYVEIVVGPGKCRKCADICRDMGIPADAAASTANDWQTNKAAVKAGQKQSKVKELFKTFGDIFIPLIPGVVASGLCAGINSLIGQVVPNYADIPALALISTLLGLLELDVAYITSVLEPLLPADVVDVVRSYLEYVSANQSRQLLWFSLIFSIWFPMRASGCLMHSLRKAFGRSAPESLWRSQLRILLFTVWLIVVIAVTLVLVVVGRSVLEFVGRFITITDSFITAWSSLRFVLLAVVMAITLVILYMLSQGQRRPLREVLPGVGGSLAAWMVLSMAFSYYVEHLGRYSVLYGSIATVIVVLLWLYMSGQILILGAEFSAALLEKRQTAAPSGGEEDA